MTSTTPTKPWAETRLPFLQGWRTYLTAPVLTREGPYLGTLPVLITATLVFMALSGFILAIYYQPAHAYDAISFTDRNVNSGWLIHGFHETGATMIFAAVFLALFRALLLAEYRAPGELVWFLSLGQLLLLLLVGYLGYAMTGGAVAYWSLVQSSGDAMALGGAPGAIGAWFFGGPAGGSTLARFAVFHVALALALFGIVALYFAARRALVPPGPPRAGVPFHPYYTAQFFAALVIYSLIFAVLVFFLPHLGENPLNRAPGNPLLLPLSLTPPWYLLPTAAFGQFVPGTLGGVVAVFAAFSALFALPWLDRSAPNSPPGGLYRTLIVLLALDVIALSLAGAAHSTIGNVLVVLFTLYYFLHFLVLTPLVTLRRLG